MKIMDKADEIMLGMLKGNNPPAEPQKNDQVAKEEVVETVPDSPDVEDGVVEEAPVETPAIEASADDGSADVEVIDDAEPESTEGSEDDIFSSWDDDADPSEVAESTDDTASFDFSSISTDLGLEADVSDSNSFKTAVKEKIKSYEAKISELESSKIPDNVPDNLKEAVKVAAEGGDYTAYLGVDSVDYKSISDVDLVANSIADHFQVNGQVDQTALNEYLDSMSDKQIQIEASKVRSQLEAHKEAQKAHIQTQAKQKRNEMLSGIKSALGNFSELNNFKIMPHHKEAISRAFTNDTAIQDMFYTNGQFDPKKAVETYASYKYSAKIIKNLSNRVKNSTKKEVISKLSNQDLDKSSTPPQASIKEKPSGLDLLMSEAKSKN